MRDTVPLLQTLLARFARCNVAFLLHQFCPTRLAPPQHDKVTNNANSSRSHVKHSPHVKRSHQDQRNNNNNNTNMHDENNDDDDDDDDDDCHDDNSDARQTAPIASVAMQTPLMTGASTTLNMSCGSVPSDIDDELIDDYRHFVLGEALPDAGVAAKRALDATRQAHARREAREAALGTASTEQLLRSFTSLHDVSRFVDVVMQRIVPRALIGDSHNWTMLRKRKR